MNRLIYVSKETAEVVEQSGSKMVKVYSFFPVDRANCDCKKMIFDWQKKLAEETEAGRQSLLKKTPFLECPRDKTKLTRYAIDCDNCGALQGYCWATDKSLSDWCDFHYVQSTTGEYWVGCFTPHISPITQKLLLECCCGQDIRDFRANMTLSEKTAKHIEDNNASGREFNKADSKFVASKFTGKVLT